MLAGNYVVVGIASLLVAKFTVHHARLQVEKEAPFSKGRETAWILLHIAVWCILVLFYGFTWEYLFAALACSALVGLSAVDLEIYEIPPEFNWFLLLLGILHTVWDRGSWPTYVIGFFAVSVIFLLIGIATKGKGMGGGDVKLMATVGLLLGWKQILLVMVLGSVLGVLIHGTAMLVCRGKERMLAFGPYLSLAALISMCVGDRLISWYLQTFFKLQ